jgi:hypothetical protein
VTLIAASGLKGVSYRQGKRISASKTASITNSMRFFRIRWLP